MFGFVSHSGDQRDPATSTVLTNVSSSLQFTVNGVAILTDN